MSTQGNNSSVIKIHSFVFSCGCTIGTLFSLAQEVLLLHWLLLDSCKHQILHLSLALNKERNNNDLASDG